MSLIIDLVRHGKAEQQAPNGDRARRLTPEGRTALESLAARLAAAGSIPTRIFSSPLERAEQTAEILVAIVAPGTEIETLDELLPDASPAGVLEALMTRGVAEGHALLVGHLPQMEDVHEYFTDASADFPVATLRRVLFPEQLGAGRGRPVLMLRP